MRKRKATEVLVSQVNPTTNSTIFITGVAPSPAVVDVPTFIAPGSTPVSYLHEAGSFVKGASEVSRVFEASFCSTDNLQVLESDSGIASSSIADGMLANIHLNADIDIARDRDFSIARNCMNGLMYLVSLVCCCLCDFIISLLLFCFGVVKC